jgi:hypothetical protein
MSNDMQIVYTNDDKLRWEVEKLKAEAVNLRRPYIRTPSSWITIMTVILGLFGVGLQYVKSDREYQLADIKRQQATLETEQTKAARQQVLEEITQAKNTLSQLQSQREQASQNLDALQAQVNQLVEKTSKLASAGEIKQVAQEVSKSIAVLNNINEQSVKQSEKATDNLQALSADISNRASQAPAFAVIASYVKLEDALAYAKQLRSKNLAFPIEVYKRSPIRYQVTLGGYLTSEEASKRVEYAKQQGIAPDAYVRSAQDWGDNLFK